MLEDRGRAQACRIGLWRTATAARHDRQLALLTAFHDGQAGQDWHGREGRRDCEGCREVAVKVCKDRPMGGRQDDGTEKRKARGSSNARDWSCHEETPEVGEAGESRLSARDADRRGQGVTSSAVGQASAKRR